MENYKIQKTKSGLKTLLVKRPKNPNLIHLQLVLAIGSDIEYKNTLELGHFLEHLFVSLTSSKYPDSKNNLEFFSHNNITYSASVESKITIYNYEFNKEKLELFLDMFLNALFDFKVDREIFKNEKNSIIEELNEIINDLSYPLETYTDSMIYKGHSREISQKLRLVNTRKTKPEDVMNHWYKYYRIPYMLLAFYGSINMTTLISLINKISSNLLNKNKVRLKFKSKSLCNLYKEYSLLDESKILFTKKIDKISTLKINWRINIDIFSDKYYKLYCLDSILLSDLNSLLLKKLRGEKGLIYDIESHFSIDEFQTNLSFYTFQTSVASHKLLNVIKAFMEVFDYIIKNEINIENFNRYLMSQKQSILARNEQLDYENTLTNYSKYILYDKPLKTLLKEDKEFTNISQKDILDVAKNTFQTNNLYISYQNNTNINKKINALIDNLDF